MSVFLTSRRRAWGGVLRGAEEPGTGVEAGSTASRLEA